MNNFKVTLTGLPDHRIAKQITVGQKYRFYNGFMSKFDGLICVVEKVIDPNGKFTVRFDNGLDIMAYSSELESL